MLSTDKAIGFLQGHIILTQWLSNMKTKSHVPDKVLDIMSNPPMKISLAN